MLKALILGSDPLYLFDDVIYGYPLALLLDKADLARADVSASATSIWLFS
jgi:hypothetical protein